jgi:DNA-binding transcriptional regulator YiaG
MFGIEIEDTTPPAKKRKTPLRKTARRANNGKSASENTLSGRGKPRAGNAKATSKKRNFTPTGTAVSKLRKQFGMTRSQFADLLGVTPQTVASWETKRGRLKLQKRTLTALTRAWLRK